MKPRLWRALLVLLTAATSLSGGNGHTARIVATSTTGGAAAPSTLIDNLSSYWTLDEAAGGARSDSLGVNDLTEHNGVTQESGHLLQAAGLNGTTRYLSAASSASLQTGDISFAVAAWIYAPTLPSSGGLIYVIASKAVASTSVEYVLYVDPGVNDIKLQIWNAGLTLNDTLSSTATLSASTWTHVVAQRNKDTGNLEMWVDGAVQGTVAISIAPAAAAGDFEVGRYGFTGDRYFAGRIDGLAYWKRALTAGEVAELYNAGVGVDYPF